MDLSAKETFGEPEDKLIEIIQSKTQKMGNRASQNWGYPSRETTEGSAYFFLRGQIVNIFSV